MSDLVTLLVFILFLLVIALIDDERENHNGK